MPIDYYDFFNQVVEMIDYLKKDPRIKTKVVAITLALRNYKLYLEGKIQIDLPENWELAYNGIKGLDKEKTASAWNYRKPNRNSERRDSARKKIIELYRLGIVNLHYVTPDGKSGIVKLSEITSVPRSLEEDQ